MTDLAIRTENLTKHYGKTIALSGLDLEVRKGEIFGFLGPNGAGKTTTIRLLLDALRPTAGGASVLGLDPWRDRVAVHRRVGLLPSELGTWKRLSAGEWLRWVAHVRCVDASSRIEELAARFQLDLSRAVGQLSMGNRRKVGVVQAFMHDPELVILDEPTSGLDPLMQLEFRRLLIECREQGRTVFLSSHALDEVQHVADRVAIIRAGELVTVEVVAKLLAQAVGRYEVHFSSSPPPDSFADVANVRECTVASDHASFAVEGSPDALIKALGRFEVTSLTCHNIDLEDVFIRYYGSGEGDNGA